MEETRLLRDARDGHAKRSRCGEGPSGRFMLLCWVGDCGGAAAAVVVVNQIRGRV